jgi:hypothetical protein
MAESAMFTIEKDCTTLLKHVLRLFSG